MWLVVFVASLAKKLNSLVCYAYGNVYFVVQERMKGQALDIYLAAFSHHCIEMLTFDQVLLRLPKKSLGRE